MLDYSDYLLAKLAEGETAESLMVALGITEEEAEYMVIQAEKLTNKYSPKNNRS